MSVHLILAYHYVSMGLHTCFYLSFFGIIDLAREGDPSNIAWLPSGEDRSGDMLEEHVLEEVEFCGDVSEDKPNDPMLSKDGPNKDELPLTKLQQLQQLQDRRKWILLSTKQILKPSTISSAIEPHRSLTTQSLKNG